MSDHQPEEEYEVEIILGKRKKKGKTQYLVKWKDWDRPEDNTWESRSNLNRNVECRELIADYEAKTRTKNQIKNGFSRGLTAEKILGATRDPGELQLLVKVERDFFIFSSSFPPSGLVRMTRVSWCRPRKPTRRSHR